MKRSAFGVQVASATITVLALQTLALAGVAGAADTPATPAGDDPPRWCPAQGVLRADELPRTVRLSDCDLRDRVVRGTRGASVTVPRENLTVAASSLHVDGSSNLRVRVDGTAGTVEITQERTATAPAQRGAAADPLDACSDDAWTSSASAWPKGSTVKWKYYVNRRIEGGITNAQARRAVRSGVTNAFDARTDCGDADQFSPLPNIFEDYTGKTWRRPNVDGRGSCTSRNGVNSFGWVSLAGLPESTLAVACTWQGWNSTIEADVALQSNGKKWWYFGGDGQSDAQCPAGHYDPASVVTHETLHALGLGHVEGDKHANLTMAPVIRACDDRVSTLGRGDYEGLIKLYGPR
ncbi:matrixin family metalloprotease [Actinomadura hibisca]|uniref:matrixin family metalloprotease n=1 Tax=Actinomadura hibisca TaxID=68565 RepID=UPI00082D2ED8|nr:matrixin family metalloprotease [Actinomadura hibisca]